MGCSDCSHSGCSQAQYAREVVQLAVAQKDAAFSVPAELVYNKKGGGTPRPARIVGCIMAPDSAAGQHQLSIKATSLQAKLALPQPWQHSDPAFLSALGDWREAEILNIQAFTEKQIIVHEARTAGECVPWSPGTYLLATRLLATIAVTHCCAWLHRSDVF